MSTSQKKSSLSTQNTIFLMSESSRLQLIDLLSDPDFRIWVKSGAFKKPSNYWSDWRLQNPEKEEIVKQAISILLASHTEDEISDMELDEIVSGTWERIANQEKPVRPLRRWWWVAASATLLLTGIWVSKNMPQKPKLSKNLTQHEPAHDMLRINSGKKPMLVMLSDSSSVLLLPGSELSYPSKFTAEAREVRLKGEAFFEISKNPGLPFLVHTKAITTRVVGTSFSVRAFDGERDVNVTVKTGKVSVYPANSDTKIVPKDAVVLLPDQNISYNTEQHVMSQLAKAAVSTPAGIKNTSFEFVDAPVTAILDSIGHAYGLKMTYNEANFKKCILTTSLTDTPLQGKLKIICRALGSTASYKISDTGIEISGNGCD